MDFYQLIHLTLIIMKTQYALGISYAINFWYKIFPLVPKEVAVDLIDLLIRYNFYEIFLHWSKNIRDAFFYLFSYRIMPFYE